MARKIRMGDLFCGAGGTSSGAVKAFEEHGVDWELTAINHWDIAVKTHTKNHPGARHLCASLDSLNPRDLYKPGDLDILWGSPECTHHSVARGGKPMNDQSRATAWCIVRWAEALLPSVILVENVKEFLSWGPIGSNGKPLKSKEGETFQAWVKCLQSLGYKVEWRILCAADYGDPTTRKRLFIQAVRGRRKIVWPEPTHAENTSADLFGSTLKPWRAAREIIDWQDQGNSIFDRKKPLAEKTMRRIMIGLEKFGFAPFVAAWDQQSGTGVWSADAPLSTITTKARHGVAEPFIIKMRGTGTAGSVDDPMPALTAGGNHIGVAQPFLVDVAHGPSKNGDAHRTRPVSKPLPTITCGHSNGDGRNIALCQPFLIGQQSCAAPRSTDDPVPTVAAAGAISLCQPFLVAAGGPEGKGRQPKSVDEPMSTVLTENHQALVNPYLVKFYSTGGQHGSVNEPLDTVTTKARFGLCRPVIELNGEKYQLDILFRMLRPNELARAQGFPDSYRFTGNTAEVVKQIGNAVPVNLSKALVSAALSQL